MSYWYLSSTDVLITCFAIHEVTVEFPSTICRHQFVAWTASNSVCSFIVYWHLKKFPLWGWFEETSFFLNNKQIRWIFFPRILFSKTGSWYYLSLFLTIISFFFTFFKVLLMIILVSDVYFTRLICIFLLVFIFSIFFSRSEGQHDDVSLLSQLI